MFLHFYDLFYFLKQGVDLNENESWSFKPNFQQWPTAKMFLADVHFNNLRSLDPKKVTINTIFFRHFKQGFSIFLEVFYKIFFV